MALRINQNISAFNAYRNLTVTDGQLAKSLEKLSSGFRINRAADDASGLVVSEGLRAQVGGLKTAVRNAQDGVSVAQTAEGALTEVHSILQRMRDLAVQASNTGSQDTSARNAAQAEFTQLNAELDRIGTQTTFGTQKLLDGSFGNTSSKVAGSAFTGGAITIASGSKFQISGTFANAAGVQTALAATDVNVAAATYNTAAAYQTALQNGLDATFTAAGFSAGTVKATVTQAPAVGATAGQYTVNLTSDKQVNNPNSVAVVQTGIFTVGTVTTVAGIAAGPSSAALAQGGKFQVGANAGESLSISITSVTTGTTGLNTATLDLVNSADTAIGVIDAAISSVSTQRASLGAYQNRFEHAINNINVAVENLSASESRIRDTDIALETVSFTRAQILSQAGTAMLAQANQSPRSVLQLLSGN